MTQERATATEPLAEGETTARRVGKVIVSVQCIRLNAAYRCSVQYAGSGFEVAELSRSYPTEQQARDAANGARTLFNRGASVQLVLDSIAYAQTVLSLAA